MKIFVIGGAGYVGSNCCKALAEAGLGGPRLRQFITRLEPKRELDRFADVMIAPAERVNAGEVDFFNQVPRLAPMRRLDDT